MPFIMIAVLIDMLSIGLIVPVLPLLVGEFTQSKADQSFWYGAVAFAFGIANFFASPVLGALSDSYGRRPVMLLGFFALGLTFFGTALATELWMLILARLVGGAMQANVSVANAYVADITPAEERARRFGMLGAMFGIGFVLGPVLGGLLGALRLDLPFFVAGSLALANLVYGYFVVPESLPPSERRAFSWSRATPLASLRSLARLRGVAVWSRSSPAPGSRSSRPTRPGCSTRASSSAGVRGRTAGRWRPSASPPASRKACFSGACSGAGARASSRWPDWRRRPSRTRRSARSPRAG